MEWYWQGKTEAPSATSGTTNPNWNGLVSNLGVCGERLVATTWPLKCEILLNSVQNSVPTSQRTNPVFTTKLMWFRDIFIVDCQNHIKKNCGEVSGFLSAMLCGIPYILESNPHPFYSFRGLKNQMRIRIACGLDTRSRAVFWKNDRAAVRAVRTIQ